MQVDEGAGLCTLHMFVEDRAKGVVRPGGFETAEEEAVGMAVLPAGGSGLQRPKPALGDEFGDGRIGFLARLAPILRHQPIVDFVIGRIFGMGRV